jgi:protocatechuate 3,4-dioxygenase beta subunit
MNDDDAPIGRLLTRRETLTLLGMSGIGASVTVAMAPEHALAGGADSVAVQCVLLPEQTEGPYFVDEALNRSDIRSDPTSGAVKHGVLLRIAFSVSQMTADGECSPLAGAQVDLWHCDAAGVYSDVRDPGFDTTGQKFLRGYQITDDRGAARFVTIYPGWYRGRTVHAHFKIRTDPGASQGYEFTSQLYFDDALTDRVHRREPYATKGQRTLRNDRDGIFRNGGPQLTLALTEDGDGYASVFPVALHPIRMSDARLAADEP